MTGLKNIGIKQEEISWYPTINQDLCSACNACLEFCEKNVFAKGELTTVVANPYNCVIGCTACLNECISDALSFPSLKELAKMICELSEKQKKIKQKSN